MNCTSEEPVPLLLMVVRDVGKVAFFAASAKIVQLFRQSVEVASFLERKPGRAKGLMSAVASFLVMPLLQEILLLLLWNEGLVHHKLV